MLQNYHCARDTCTMHAFFKATIILALLGLAYAAVQPKIVGGGAVAIEELPYQAELETALLGLFWKFACGAVIVGPNSIVTTAGCIYASKPGNIRIRSGSSVRGGGNVHNAVNVTIHPDYTDTFDNDIAFITVEPRFIFHEGVKPIRLATYEAPVGNNATVSGWGRTDPDIEEASEVLRKATVPIVDREKCAKSYEGVGNVTAGMLCAGFLEGGVDSCAGDTGGPLQIDDVLIGLVSWGYGCAKPGYPAVYTNTVYYRSWIQELIDNA